VINYIIRRFLISIVTLFLVSLLTFFMLQLVPGGDPARAMLGLDATQQEVDALRHKMYLDRPVFVQYGHWVWGLFQGDMGTSIKYNEQVNTLIGKRLPVTLNISALALIVAALVGITAGIVCATVRGSLLDQIVSVLANMGMAIPVFWLGILGIYFFGLAVGWLPVQGYVSPFEDFVDSVKHMILPVFCMCLTSLAVLTRQTRSAMLEVIRQDYIRTAFSKGLRQRVIIVRHALRNAFIPIVTLLGFTLPALIAGSVLIETVFNIPGMGRLLVTAVLNKDYMIVQAGVVIIGALIVMVNLVVDISYGWIDPRIRYS
jgi:peptide/nickel transport system permease protein